MKPISPSQPLRPPRPPQPPRPPRFYPVRRRRRFRMRPHNINPHMPFYDTPKEDRMGFKDWDRVFDNYDDSSMKPGMPYTSLLGAQMPVRSVGVCPRCQTSMFMRKNLWFCPHCRRQLMVQAPDSEYPNETESGRSAWNLPSEFETQFDLRKESPQQAPGSVRDY